MEERLDFCRVNETMQVFKARRASIMNDAKNDCNKIQLEADKKKAERHEQMSNELIGLAQEEDAYLMAYRQWKTEQKLN